MLRSLLKYSTLVIFLFSVVSIVYLQFNSGQSINTLIQSNALLLKELQTQRNLQRLQAQVITVESDVRGAIITENKIFLEDIGKEIGNIKSGLSSLNISFNDGVTDSINKILSSHVADKLSFSLDIIKTYNLSGKAAAEDLINTGRGKEITDSIVHHINLLNTNRQMVISDINQTIAANEKKARSRGLTLAIVAAITSIFAFLYVIAISRKRQSLINNLHESQQREKQAALIKEQFLSNMSHEIRTPLNAILGFTNLLKKTSLTNNQQEYVQNMEISGQNLLNITNEILDLSKIEAGMMRIEKAPFHFPTVIASIEGMFREKALSKQISLQVKIDESIPEYLVGDQFRLTQILTNLVSNALKFTDKGSIHIEASKDKRNAEETGVLFHVKDEGIGISASRLEAIFERFQQAEKDTTQKYGGTGLGLSIVKQLVLLQGGEIKVESKLGAGTSFYIWLPFGIDQSVAYDLPTQKVKEQSQDYNFYNLRVLIADDNELNRQLLKHLLNVHKVHHTIVADGKEALEKYAQGNFNLLLLDIEMPGMNGFEVIRSIREKDKTIPVIAMTAYALPGDKEKCLNAGFSSYISKPVHEEELIQMLYQFQPGDGVKNGASYINLRYLKELSGGDKTFEKKILDQFELQLPRELEQLTAAVANKDSTKVAANIHNMKSTLGYVGLYNMEVNNLLSGIEDAVKQNVPGKAETLIYQLQLICKQALSDIN